MKIDLSAQASDASLVFTLRALRLGIIASIVAPLLLLAAAGWLDYEWTFKQAEMDALSTTGLLREHTQKIIETNEVILNEVDRHTKQLSRDEIRRQQANLAADLQQMIARYPLISAIGLADAEGRQWVSASNAGSPQAEPGVDLSGREFWNAQRTADRGLMVSQASVAPQTGLVNFALSRRRGTPHGLFDGTVHIVISVAYFNRFWNEVMRSRTGTRVALIRGDGVILVHLPTLAKPPQPLTRLNSPLLQHLPLTEDKSYIAVSPIDGTRCLYVAAKIGDYPLYISYGIPLHVSLAAWVRRMLFFGAICLAVTISLVAIETFAIRQVCRLRDEQLRRRQVEKAALQAQRFEILGQLSSILVHDCGNIIQSIESASATIRRRATDEIMLEAVGLISEAAKRGRILCRRLLDTARTEDFHEAAEATLFPVDVVGDIASFLASILAPEFTITCEVTAEGLPDRVSGDPGGLERVIINFVMNACDAMPDGGTICIRLDAETLAECSPKRTDLGLRPGTYAHLSVTDSGTGMPPEVLARIGQPFFTTKPNGTGTGLGIASVWSYAKTYGGHVRLESAQGIGTTAHLWLPAVPRR